MEDEKIEPTIIQRRLELVGKILGMDIYIDTAGQREPDKKRNLAVAILHKHFTGEKKHE